MPSIVCPSFHLIYASRRRSVGETTLTKRYYRLGGPARTAPRCAADYRMSLGTRGRSRTRWRTSSLLSIEC